MYEQGEAEEPDFESEISNAVNQLRLKFEEPKKQDV